MHALPQVDFIKGVPYLALADALLPVVLAAARLQLDYYNDASLVVDRKADATPVTVADRESESLILTALAKIAPDVPVVAEEAAAAGCVPRIGDAFFLVDPLDGTKEFISRNGEFTINIALVAKGVPVFGLIYAPVLGEYFVTLSRDRAVVAKVDAASAATRMADLTATDLRARVADMAALTVIASRSHMNVETEAFLAGYHVANRETAGSSLKFCRIAAGRADMYPRAGATCEWDVAAGHAILAAAGGAMTTLDGKRFPYGKADEGYRNPGYVAWGRRVAP